MMSKVQTISGHSPTEVVSVFHDTASAPPQNRTRRLRFAQPDGGVSPDASPPIVRRATPSSGTMGRVPASPQRHRRYQPDATALNVSEALQTLKHLAIMGSAVGCTLFAVSHAASIGDVVAGAVATLVPGALPTAALGWEPLSLRTDARKVGDERFLSPLVRAAWSGAGRDDNYSGSTSTEAARSTQESSPVAAVFVACLLALIALGLARWPSSDRTTAPAKRGLAKPRLFR